jgi:hypothetical protein
MDIDDTGRTVNVNVDARSRPPQSWLWKFAALALGLLVALELSAIERHLRVIAEAQMLGALGVGAFQPAPPTEPIRDSRISNNRVANQERVNR